MLTSPHNSRVKLAVKLRERKHRQREGLMLVEGCEGEIINLAAVSGAQAEFIGQMHTQQTTAHRSLQRLAGAEVNGKGEGGEEFGEAELRSGHDADYTRGARAREIMQSLAAMLRSLMVAPLDKSILCPVLISRESHFDALNQRIAHARAGQGQLASFSHYAAKLRSSGSHCSKISGG
jgi:hypothetical protein